MRVVRASRPSQKIEEGETIMSGKAKVLVLLAVCSLVAGSAQSAMVQIAEFRSGVDTVYVLERPIPKLGSPSTPPSHPGDFDVFGPDSLYHEAVVIAAHPDWRPALSVDDLAQWISVNENGAVPSIDTASGLYAVMVYYNQTNDVITGIVLDLWFTADNYLGGHGMSALYWNGEALDAPGDIIADAKQLFKNEYYVQFVGLELQPGENWLYLDATSFAGPAGVLFSGTLSAPDVDVPEPVSMGLLAAGAIGMILRRKR